jgi:hypothetical protein
VLTIRKRGRIFHCRRTVRCGKKTELVKEHSTGCSERNAAEAYKAQLEYEIQQRLLLGETFLTPALAAAWAKAFLIDRTGLPL